MEDIQDSGADASLTTPDDEETVPAGTEGEMNSEEPETAQPEVGAESPQEEVDHPRNAYDWLVLYSLNSALRQEEAMGERMEAVLAVLFPEETGETI